jgi:exodeoxyribonuclease V alpha subunit
MTTRGLFATGSETFVEGEVLRVTFENRETGFRVVQLGVVGKKDRVTVVGTLPALRVGARLRVRGRMVTDARHGEQLKAEGATELRPSTAKGIARYLASGVVPGIGEKLASRIVDTFGDATLEVLDERPERLAEVAGLGKKRRDALRETWHTAKAERDVLVFLQTNGATASLAARILKRYGKDASRIVQKDPYRLALEVAGVGFKTADRVASGLGIAKDAPERVQAGLMQALLDAADSGHTCMPTELLEERALALLGITDEGHELVSRALHVLALATHVVLERDPRSDGDLVYPPRLYEAERRVAMRILELSRARVPVLSSARDAIDAFERALAGRLEEEQRDAVVTASRAPVLIVTGGPGVGKTTVLKAILAVFRDAGLGVRLAAPTGRAAKRMTLATGYPASTLHRLLEFDPQRGGTWKRDARSPLDAGAVIVDEASMLDLPLADALLQAISPGARLVLVGDDGQLPSIGPGSVLRDLIASRVTPCVTLKRIFRQAHGSHIVENAHRIHDGLPPLADNAEGSDFFILERGDPDSAQRSILELVTSRIPKRFGLDPMRDVQVLTPMHRGAAGSLALNLALQAALNPHGAVLRHGQRELRVGDKVMQLKNDYDRSVYNGDIGVVESVDARAGSLVVRFDEGEGEAARISAYEGSALDALTLAYACSVHKAQGSEYPAVVIALMTSHFMMLSRNLLYTAVTRGKRLVVLVADPRAIRMALAKAKKDDRHTRLSDRILAANATRPLTKKPPPSTLGGA